MQRIEHLTPAQDLMLLACHEEWLRVGLCTDPADRHRAEAAIRAMYALANEPVPWFIWCSSPITCLLTMKIINRCSSKQAPASLGASLEASLGASLGDSLGDSLKYACWGQHEAYWVAHYLFSQQIGVKYDDSAAQQLKLWAEVSQSCCWWWPYRGLVICSERPSIVSMEPDLRHQNVYLLHNGTGPALQFRDGWAIYAIHGVRVPERVIMAPETITANDIMTERNAEVRRVMIDRFGPGRYIRESGAKLLNRDDWGSLWRVDMAGDEPLVMVEVINSTPESDGTFKTYFLRVDPQLRPLRIDSHGAQHREEPQALTAHNAIASTFGRRGEEYAPTLQT